jgi:hypothetical protein
MDRRVLRFSTDDSRDQRLADTGAGLPLDERAEMAAELPESLHHAEEDVEAASAAEIQQRVAAA